jgi:D-glycero-alpha-D-manno-heptose 1-phosphate guanylyltransferase
MEAIVLAGGLGTRLRGVIGDAPKCMAPVNGKPFLAYLLGYLAAQHCSRVILSLGYSSKAVTDWLAENPQPFPVHFVIEEEPLGTGGGMALALALATENNVVVLNGDTMFLVGLQDLVDLHTGNNAAATLALKPMQQFERYGAVHVDGGNQIQSFEEKKYMEQGLINGGIYVINKTMFFNRNLPRKCSFEKDFLEQFVGEHSFYGYICDGYFIDIGIPADYTQSMTDFKSLFP